MYMHMYICTYIETIELNFNLPWRLEHRLRNPSAPGCKRVQRLCRRWENDQKEHRPVHAQRGEPQPKISGLSRIETKQKSKDTSNQKSVHIRHVIDEKYAKVSQSITPQASQVPVHSQQMKQGHNAGCKKTWLLIHIHIMEHSTASNQVYNQNNFPLWHMLFNKVKCLFMSFHETLRAMCSL